MAHDRALIVVDVQNDFCPGGSLAVEGGDVVASKISEFIRDNTDHYASIVATMDWHIAPGTHFASYSGEDPNYITNWPNHCVANSAGADLHPNLELPPTTVIAKKGQYNDGYSGFTGIIYDAWTDTNYGLADFLKESKISTVDIVGIATDHCVLQTAISATQSGFNCRVILDLTAAVNPDELDSVFEALQYYGCEIVNSEDAHVQTTT